MPARLSQSLAQLIRQQGPITVAQYMAEAARAYYAEQEPFGAAGDFTTAPEISQMFGELLGLWSVQTWIQLGRPAPFLLVELGPGRGTLLADALRAAKVRPEFIAALDLHLVETSPRLRTLQAQAVTGLTPTWHETPDSLPEGPMIMLANEFFDALPIRQFVRAPDGWHERMICLGANQDFAFALSPDPVPIEPLLAPSVRQVATGSIIEINASATALAGKLAERCKRQPGAVLIVDYGPPASGIGDSLQALKAHRPHPVLREPGSADITAHVDFAALARAAAGAGAQVFGPVPQGAFLRRLGIEQRAGKLRTGGFADPTVVDAALERLTAPEAMGTLFQVMAITSPAAPAPAGFEA